MLKTLGKQAIIGAALTALAIGAGPSAAQDGSEEYPLLRTCEEAYIGLTSLAVGDDGAGVREFADGQVVVMQIDQIEPAAASFGVVILTWEPLSELGGRMCHAATQYNYLDVDAATSQTDDANRLTLTFPTRDYDHENGESVEGKPLVVSIDLEQGEVAARR